jgi:ParB family transcriptional regulator, chromosome partitioning protein
LAASRVHERFGCSLEELARRFQHSKSWVSRRLALNHALPQTVQEHVRLGVLSAHAAMKYLVPLARANAQAAAQFSTAIVPLNPTTREVAVLYAGRQSGSTRTCELILGNPRVYLDAKAAKGPGPPTLTQRFLDDLGALAGIARRAVRTLERGLVQQLLAHERDEISGTFVRTKADVERLFHRLELEYKHAGRSHPNDDLEVA